MFELWIATWIALNAVFLLILFTQRRKVYVLYFLTGMAFGYFFDFVSFTQGYYSYPDFFLFTVLGIPLSMTIAEGASVAITIRMFEFLKKH